MNVALASERDQLVSATTFHRDQEKAPGAINGPPRDGCHHDIQSGTSAGTRSSICAHQLVDRGTPLASFLRHRITGALTGFRLYWFASYGTPIPSTVVANGLAHLGLSPASYAAYALALTVVKAAVCYLAAAVLFWRRSTRRMAYLIALFLVALPSSDTYPLVLHTIARTQPIRATTGSVVELVGFTLILWVFLLFPDGRLALRWTRLVAACWLVVGVGSLFFQGTLLDALTWPMAAFAGFLVVGFSVGASTQLWRYRRIYGPVERQQAKWMTLGLTVLLGTFAIENVLAALVPMFEWVDSPTWTVLADLILQTADNLSFVAIPIALAVAILRYRLFDIDILIRRTLVYGALTATLLVSYWGSVVLSQQFFRAVTGAQSNLAIVASTLGMAIMVQPLRDRVQGFVDQRFYRRKYNAAKVIVTFSSALRHEVDLDQLRAQLLAVVEDTMQPRHVALWLRPPNRKNHL